MILTPLQKLPNNVGDLVKIIAATGFEWLSKVQKIAKSGHTGREATKSDHFLRQNIFSQIVAILLQSQFDDFSF